MEEFLEVSRFFEKQYPLNKHGLEELFALFSVKEYPKNTKILTHHTRETKLRFLIDGVVREYYFHDAKETNIHFYTKPQFITDFSSFVHDYETKKNQEALTDIKLLVIYENDFRELLGKYQCGGSFVNLSFQKLLKQKEIQEYNRTIKSPEELYKELFIYHPDWLQLIPQYHIASYLGITPETLSRIRKRAS